MIPNRGDFLDQIMRENKDRETARKKLERVKGIEPSYSAWKAAALPLSYTRTFNHLCRYYFQIWHHSGTKTNESWRGLGFATTMISPLSFRVSNSHRRVRDRPCDLRGG